MEAEVGIEPTWLDLQPIHNTSNFNRLASLAFRKLLIFKGLCSSVFEGPVSGFGMDFFNPWHPTWRPKREHFVIETAPIV